MDLERFIDLLFEEGKKAGFTHMEVFEQSMEKLEITAYKGEIDSFNLSDDRGVSFRGIYQGKMGYSYTEKVDEKSIEMLISMAKDNAKVIESNDKEEIFEGSKEYPVYHGYSHKLTEISNEEKIKFLLELEGFPMKLDKRVIAVPHCVLVSGEEQKSMINTKNLNISSKNNMIAAYLSVLVSDGKDNKSGFAFLAGKDFAKFDPSALAREAVDEGLSKLGGTTIKSGNYPVIFQNKQISSLMSAYWSIFSAENVQKDLSKLKNRLNDKIASDKVNIIDHPLLEEGLSSATFDGEGVATYKKDVVSKGILKTYLHNLKTAAKDGVESTGNAYKGSYKGTISIAPFNFYIENGEVPLDTMIKRIDKGVYITDLQGLHAGTDSVSGDFSLFAGGFLIEGGKIKHPVEQITVSGNFYDLLLNIEEIADDLKFGLPSAGTFGSPSVLVSSLSIAGD